MAAKLATPRVIDAMTVNLKGLTTLNALVEVLSALSVESIVLLCVTVRAYQHETFRVCGDFLQRHTPGFPVVLVGRINVMEVQGAGGFGVSASRALATKLSY